MFKCVSLKCNIPLDTKGRHFDKKYKIHLIKQGQLLNKERHVKCVVQMGAYFAKNVLQISVVQLTFYERSEERRRLQSSLLNTRSFYLAHSSVLSCFHPSDIALLPHLIQLFLCFIFHTSNVIHC